MTREELARFVALGNSVPDQLILRSPWLSVFERRLLGLRLVRVENREVKFEIQDPNQDEPINERDKFFQVSLFRRKSWEVEDLINSLMAHTTPHVNPEFSSPGLRRNNLILKALEEHFYKRFAKELFDRLKLARENNQDSLVTAAPLLANFIYSFAIKSQGGEAETEEEKKEREKIADQKSSGGYSLEELKSALDRLDLDFEKIQAILEGTKDKRLRLKAKALYQSIVNHPQINTFFGKDDRLEQLFKVLKETGLELYDIDGSKEELIAAYSNCYNDILKSIIATIQREEI